jgi:hypothetical protein
MSTKIYDLWFFDSLSIYHRLTLRGTSSNLVLEPSKEYMAMMEGLRINESSSRRINESC